MSDEQQAPTKVEANAITISIKGQDGTLVEFKLKTTTKLIKAFNAYAEKTGQDVKTLRFVSPDGDRIAFGSYETVTAEALSLEDGDCIDAFVEQVGGSTSIAEKS